MADNPYAGLRSMALGTTAEALKLDALGPNDCYGILMETGYEQAVATLVCFLSGDTSLYFSNGGGVIGAGQHANVADAAKRFVTMGAKFVHEMREAAEAPLPALGVTIFYVLTTRARYAFDAPETELGNSRSALSPLFHAAHEVIFNLRPLMR
ncbi:MAG TPA: hypothetical protein VLV55_10755 [Rhizomicrobium sp.]|nr:hypothetical protein [Rhizomicrobium sp.]